MRTKEIATLAIGQEYLRCAIACLKSCRRHADEPYVYRLYYAYAKPGLYEVPDWIQLESIEKLVSSILPRGEYLKTPTFAREFKHVPLTHPKGRSHDVLFLDVDVYAFASPFRLFFDLIEASAAILFAKDKKEFPIYRNPRLSFDLNLVEEGKRIGTPLTNLSPNTGIMGRAADSVGLAFADRAADLMRRRALTPYPEDTYFNDEPYFSVAYQMEVLSAQKGFIDISTEDYVHTHKIGVLRDENSDTPDVHWVHNDTYFKDPKLIHFIGFREFPWYLDRVEGEVPHRQTGDRVR